MSKHSKKNYTTSLLATAFLLPVFMPNISQADSCQKWGPKLTVGAFAGNKDHYGIASVFAPLYQTTDSMMFMHLNFLANNRSNQEGNFGLGYRWFNDDRSVITGVYAYYDHKNTKMGNSLNQATIGVERLTDTWDMRANVYIPHSKKHMQKGQELDIPGSLNNQEASNIFKGNDRLISRNGEVALAGTDFEIGRSVPRLTDLRLYVGGFYFKGRDGAESLKGIQTRISYAINPYISLEALSSYDKHRGTHAYGGVKFSIKLGTSAKKTAHLTALEKRMEDLPIRDKDIIARPIKDVMKETGHYHVKLLSPRNPKDPNDFEQDGTFEKPFVKGSAAYKTFIAKLISENLPKMKNDSGVSVSLPHEDTSSAVKGVYLHDLNNLIKGFTPKTYIKETAGSFLKIIQKNFSNPFSNTKLRESLENFAGEDLDFNEYYRIQGSIKSALQVLIEKKRTLSELEEQLQNPDNAERQEDLVQEKQDIEKQISVLYTDIQNLTDQEKQFIENAQPIVNKWRTRNNKSDSEDSENDDTSSAANSDTYEEEYEEEDTNKDISRFSKLSQRERNAIQSQTTYHTEGQNNEDEILDVTQETKNQENFIYKKKIKEDQFTD